MNNLPRINRIRISIINEMRKIRKPPYTPKNIKRHDLLQKRLEKCNVLLFGTAQPFNH